MRVCTEDVGAGPRTHAHTRTQLHTLTDLFVVLCLFVCLFFNQNSVLENMTLFGIFNSIHANLCQN